MPTDTSPKSYTPGLEALGYRVWIDRGELRVGDSLVTAISSAIDQVDFLLAIAKRPSEATGARRNCLWR